MGGGRAPPPFRAGFSATSPAAAAGNPLSFRPGFFTTNHSAISFRTAAAAAVPPSFLASTLLVDVPSSPPAPLLGARARALAYFSQSFPSLLLSSRALRGSFFSLPSFTGRPPLLSVRCSSKPPIPSRLRLCLGVVRCSCLRLLTGISAFPVLTPTPASPLPCASHRPLRMRCRALMPQSFDRQRIAY